MPTRLIALLAGLALAAAPRVALAQEADDLGTGGAGITGFGIGDWMGLTFRLGLVLLVVWGGIAVLRWYSRRLNGAGGSSRHLEVLETRTLAPNRSLHLIRIGGRAVLIGVTPDRINSLLEIGDPDEVERLSMEPANAPSNEGMFANMARGLSESVSRLRSAASLRPANRRQEQIVAIQNAISRARSDIDDPLEQRR